MNQFLFDLLQGRLDVNQCDYDSIPGYEAVVKRREEQFERLEGAFGSPYAEEVWDYAAKAAEFEVRLYFERGFRLAGQFFLAMLS